ncbi:MAG: endonuclease/exonuclease/phosphatase family protein [Polyangiaceae bacterium]|nr:endonuclease/exonuclease/phosphatase family protein [Polyangiaceae bacterium]
MMTFLFWNCRKATDLVGKLVAEHRVDVLVLAESHAEPARILSAIEDADGARFEVDPLCQDIAIFTRFSASALQPEHDEPGLSIRRIPTVPEDILLVAMHLLSKDNASDADQASLTPIYAAEIGRIERKLGMRRTLLVGDLNMNPFDHGVVQATGFHAISSRQVATQRGNREKGGRTVDTRWYPYFYNPMWRFFGDAQGTPPGTFFRDKGGPIAYFWHLYDQVLIRPDLVPRFVDRDLMILSQCGDIALVNAKGEPSASDHLPVLFRLNLEAPGAIHGQASDSEPRTAGP